MIQIIKKTLFIVGFCWTLSVSAQSDKIPISDTDYQNSEVEMADKFREDGKIYVVVAVLSVILGGLITYLVVIDRKTARLEKMVFEK